MAAAGVYPVRVDASLDAPLSRWLWLVKWLLLFPHFVLLMFLWIAFAVLSVAAFFSILFTGYYPRGIFEFNVGVLRWTWRVDYYALGAFGTDRYPPFALEDDPAYPAHLEVEYPGRLSRGLVLVKWWLLAIPHYIVVGLFTGGGLWATWQVGTDSYANWGGWGLIAILAVFAAVVLAFTGRYPRQIFDFVLGMDRWVLRVAAYAGLMTDTYPPFRLDMGGQDPGTVTLPAPPPGPAFPAPPVPEGQGAAVPPAGGSAPAAPAAGPPPAPGQPGTMVTGPAGGGPGQVPSGRGARGWTAGRIASAIAGVVVGLLSLGMIGAGSTALWASSAADRGGYVPLGTVSYSTPGYAVTSETVELHTGGGGWDAAQTFIGTVRIRVTSTTGAPVFVGIAPAGDAARYLAGVPHATVRGIGGGNWYAEQGGSFPALPPASAGIWAAQASGTGTQTLVWQTRSGDWTVVAMNADASRPVSLRADVAATLPWLPWLGAGLLAGGIVVLAGAVVLIVIPVRRASRSPGSA